MLFWLLFCRYSKNSAAVVSAAAAAAAAIAAVIAAIAAAIAAAVYVRVLTFIWSLEELWTLQRNKLKHERTYSFTIVISLQP